MSSWVSHFVTAPERLTVLGMNEQELAANEQAAAWVVHDLNADPVLPFPDASFDHATCCVSVDYLTRPIEVFREVARVLRPRRLVRVHVLESPVPDEGDPGLALRRQPDPHEDRQRVLRTFGRVR